VTRRTRRRPLRLLATKEVTHKNVTATTNSTVAGGYAKPGTPAARPTKT